MFRTNFRSGQARRCGDEGAIIILFCVCLVVLFAFLIFVIDATRLGSSNRQQTLTAEYVGLAALEAYTAPIAGTPRPILGGALFNPMPTDFSSYNAEIEDQHTTRMNRAVARATEVAGINFVTSRYGSGHVSSPTETAEIAQSEASLNRNDQAGFIEPGLWFDVRPAACGTTMTTTCPCNLPDPADPASAPLTRGCFISCADTGGTACRDVVQVDSAGNLVPAADRRRVEANAFRVRLNTKNNDLIQNPFAGLFHGMGEGATSGQEAIVVSTPRNTVIAFDLSLAMIRDTYFGIDESLGVESVEPVYRCKNTDCGDDCNESSEISNFPYAAYTRPLPFRLPPDEDLPGEPNCASVDRDGNPTTGITRDENDEACPQPANPNDFRNTLQYSGLNGSCSAANSYGCLSAAERADYQCVEYSTPDRAGTPLGTMLVRKTPGEPYGTFLRAMNDLIRLHAERSSLGDRLIVFGFDREVVFGDAAGGTFVSGVVAGRRVFGPFEMGNNEITFDNSGNVTGARSDLGELRDLLDMSSFDPAPINLPLHNTSDDINLRIRNMFFPRFERYSDIPMALRRAVDFLQRDGRFAYMDNNVYLLSNGISRCHRVNADNAVQCSTIYAEYTRSIEETLRQVIGTAVPAGTRGTYLAENVKLNVLFTGRNVEPHTVVYKDMRRGGNVCIPERELRDRGFPHAMWGFPRRANNTVTDEQFIEARALAAQEAFAAFPTGNGSKKLFDSAYYLSAAAAATGGVWIPIRATNDDPPGGDCDAACDVNGSGLQPDLAEICGDARPVSGPQRLQTVLNGACSRASNITETLADPTTAPDSTTIDSALMTGDGVPNDNIMSAPINPPDSLISRLAPDPGGRVICDPYCRPKVGRQGQVESSLDRVFCRSTVRVIAQGGAP